MNFLKRLINRNAKPINLDAVIVDEEIDSPVELKSGSSRKVSIIFYEANKEIQVSEDVAKILIEKNAAELCQ